MAQAFGNPGLVEPDGSNCSAAIADHRLGQFRFSAACRTRADRLDSTNTWTYLPGNITGVTLTDIPSGFHTFYVQAIDTAGALSNLLQFPDTTDAASPNGWRVEEPVGDILLVDDYKLDDGSTHAFYTSILDSIEGLNNYSVFELGVDEKALPLSSTDRLAMFSYFKTVVWYHYSEIPTLPGADGALRTYLETGGNVFVSSIFIDAGYIQEIVMDEYDNLFFSTNNKRIDINFYRRKNGIAFAKWVSPTKNSFFIQLYYFIVSEWCHKLDINRIKVNKGVYKFSKWIFIQLLLLIKPLIPGSVKKFLNEDVAKRLKYTGYSYPEELMVFNDIDFMNIKVRVPVDYKKYLELTYGSDWSTPKKNYVWFHEAKNLLEHN